MKLNVDYSVLVPPGVTTSAEALGQTLVSNKAAFETTMAASYAEAYEANTGSPPPGFSGVVASDQAGTKVVTVAPETTTVQSAPAPTTAAAEEEDGNTGAIVGGVVGATAGVGL